jgi:hypothetical protein
MNIGGGRRNLTHAYTWSASPLSFLSQNDFYERLR